MVFISSTITFENFKKNYGEYATEIFRKDTAVWITCYFFIVVILTGAFALILSDSNNALSVLLLNLTCFYFCLAVGTLIPFGNSAFNKSLSRRGLNEIITSISAHDFKTEPPPDLHAEAVYRIANSSDTNKIDVISAVLYFNINAGDNKNSIQVLIGLFKKIDLLLTKQNLSLKEQRNIIFTYAYVLQTSFDLYHSKKDAAGIQTILASLNSLNAIIAENHYGAAFIEKMFTVIIYITQSLIESEDEKLLDSAIWVYYHMCNAHLNRNVPAENETWEHTEDGATFPISTDARWANDNKFQKIDDAATFHLNDVLQRSFLCRNFYIIEQCVKMYSVFAEMIIFNNTLGPLQKERIGSTLAYHSIEAIKRFTDMESAAQRFNTIRLYIGTTNILSVLEENSKFGDTVFICLIDLIDHLIKNGKIRKYDMEELGDLCRLIIADSAKIQNAGNYVSDILRLQAKLKSQCFKEILKGEKGTDFQRQKEMAALIQSDIKSYLAAIEKKHNSGGPLKSIIAAYV